MTNKTFCHGNNVNNNNQSKASHSLLSSANKAATAAAASSTQSSSALSNSNSSNTNNTSNTAQANNSSNSSNTKPCSGGGNNDGSVDREANVGSGGGSGAGIIKAYAHGIWYQEYDTIDNSVQQHIQLLQQQRQRFYSNNVGTTMSPYELDGRGNVLRPNNDDEMKNNKRQQQQQRWHKGLKDNSDSNNNNANSNNCDIVVVDIEDEQLYNESDHSPQPAPLTNRITLSQYPINASAVRNCRQAHLKENITSSNHHENVGHVLTANDNVVNDDDDDDGDDDSLASMETLSDNVSIWIDGEKHWIAGVDAQTTCADLIWALLNYQNGQPEHTLNANDGSKVVDASTAGKEQQQQQQTFRWHNKDIQTQSSINSNKVSGSASASSNSHTTTIISTVTTSTGNINQSMPKNTKEEENCKITQNSSRLTPPMSVHTATATSTGTGSNATVLPCGPVTTFPFPPGITTAAQLAMEYVIVKQYHHCEEYLDGSTKVFDVLPPRNSQPKKECELLLRRLGPAPMSVYANNNTTTPQLSSLISTDKDSGMGSPVGSARSAKFRRRKHKSSQWLAQANTLHPKLSRCTATANERLLKIILTQDETIQRQLSLLREKERQINKIEEEKHRKRERELGKNYLLETYLNGLDEAECEPEQQDGEEIFIDEPYHQQHSTANPMPCTSAAMMTSQKDALGLDMIMLDNFKPRESKKDKKKKRHKEKSTNERNEMKPSSTTNINRPKQREERLMRLYGNETSNIPGSIVNDHDHERNVDDADAGDVDVNNKAEMEMQIFWLEKVYTLNKQLQKEEELAAKLHAKIRKHQLKKANQTQKEVQLEMDKLDNGLAMQCGNIRRVEANLMETNDQLQKKLLILERLSLEYLRQQEAEQADEAKQNLANEKGAAESKEMHKLSLNNIKSVEEVQQLQKLIAKPGFNLTGRESAHKTTTTINPVMCQHSINNDDDVPADIAPAVPQYGDATALLNHPADEGQTAFVGNNERHLISSSNISKAALSTALITSQRIMAAPKACLDRQLTGTPPPPPSSAALASLCLPSATASSSAATSRTISPVCVVLDKNMLSSLHVQNAKTIMKQMFHSQTTLTAAAGTATATPSALTPPPTTATATPSITSSITTTATATPTAHANSLKPTAMNAFPPKQPCQSFNQHMQLPLPHLHPHPLPLKLSMVSSTSPRTLPPAHLTSWPQHSHQLPAAAGIVDPAASLAPIQATMAVALSAAAAASSSSSSPASLMAMNTVDISQLGTLV